MSDVQCKKVAGLLTCWVGGRETWMTGEPEEAH